MLNATDTDPVVDRIRMIDKMRIYLPVTGTKYSSIVYWHSDYLEIKKCFTYLKNTWIRKLNYDMKFDFT